MVPGSSGRKHFNTSLEVYTRYAFGAYSRLCLVVNDS